MEKDDNIVYNINISEFNDQNINIYAVSYAFVGNAPSNVQFFVTDSISNFLMSEINIRKVSRVTTSLLSMAAFKS